MPYKRFASYNIIGGAAWVLTMTVGGYFLGQFEVVRKHIELIVVGIILVSVLPAVVAWARQRSAQPEKA